jgi:hypothetical protein
MTTVDLRCRCGSVLGSMDFSRPSLVRVVCHCDDCAAYARHIGSDQATQIVQATPDQVKIAVGTEYLRCLRLTDRGLTRWCAGCCMTPLANTSRCAWMPFVGVMRCVLDSENEALLGPARHVNGAHPTPWGTLLRSASSLLLGFLLRRYRPNAFFAENGEPVARPERLR